ncbi:MAG: hypothetical protein Kow00120_02130 [Anaerolineae bacterium]
MSEKEPQISEQMQKGIAAAKAGDKATARTYFERVVAMDKYSEKAWFWLASVVESDEERRVCLGNVVHLNPNNERARRLLEKLESEAADATKGGDAPDGVRQIDRRTLMIGGAVGGVILLALLLVLLGGGGGGSPQPTATPAAGAGAPTPTATVNLYPTFTPSPTATVVITNTPVPVPSPAGIPGRLVFGSGPRFYNEAFLPILYASTDGSGRFTVGDADTQTRGRYPVFSRDGTWIIYELGLSDGTSRVVSVDLLGENRTFLTDGAVIEVTRQNAQGTPVVRDEEIRFGTENHPSLSPNGRQLAFSGFKAGTFVPQIWVITLDPETPRATQITDNEFLNTWPIWSPDGQRLIYVTDRRAQGGVDLHIARADGTGDANLTFDGYDLIERAPDWSPDTRRVVFEGTSAENRDKGDYDAYDSDIYIIDDVDGGAAPRLLYPPAAENEGDEEAGVLAETARDMLPRFSPDGRYIAFTSNRTGNWEVYILVVDTGELFQVTHSDREIDIIGDWGTG